jgi:hypothetical protein
LARNHKKNMAGITVRRLENTREDIDAAVNCLTDSLRDDPRWDTDLWGKSEADQEKLRKTRDRFLREVLLKVMCEHLIADCEGWGAFRGGADDDAAQGAGEQMVGAAIFVRPGDSKRPPVGKLLKVISKAVHRFPLAVLKFGKAEGKFTSTVTNLMVRGETGKCSVCFCCCLTLSPVTTDC